MNMHRSLVCVGMALGWTMAGASAQEKFPVMAPIPAGEFVMGDHHGFVDPKHGGDEIPLHTVRLDAFQMGIFDVTSLQYVEFLNSALAQRQLEVRQGGVYLAGGSELLCETREMSPYSRVSWADGKFSVLDHKENHPIVCIRWPGAVVYCNWLSAQKKLPLCYDVKTWECNFNLGGFRLPTEAEWEWAGRGGQLKPYRNFPWGDEPDATKANWPESKNPFRTGPLPWTTPVGFFNGQLHHKADFGWPGAQESFQSGNGVNGYGLYDMAGNVWQFINDWYVRDYYTYSPTNNPPGPASGSLVQDGKPYRGMRGGNWYNGENGHSRVSNRNPSYYRGPQDPDHPYYHLGFRVVLPVNAESRPVIKPTPVQNIRGQGNPPGGGGKRPRQGGRPEGHQRPGGGGDDRPNADRRPGGSVEEQPSTISHQPSSINHSSSTISHQPSSINHSSSTISHQPSPSGSFVLRSSAVKEDGVLPKEFTGDGESISPPLEWTGAPAGTKSFALIMHHNAPDMVKWYWVLYNIPADVKSLPKGVQGVGTAGKNSVNRDLGYAPPHSKGPGQKTYILTIYALSAPPQLTAQPSEVNREVLLAAMKDKILASAELSVNYTRTGVTEGGGGDDRRPGQGRRPREANQPDNNGRPPPPRE